MSRSASVRNGACVAGLAAFLLCLLVAVSYSQTIRPAGSVINRKEIEDPADLIPHCDMGEPGDDPFGRTNTLSSSGGYIEPGDGRLLVDVPRPVTMSARIDLVQLLRLLYKFNAFGFRL